jgi:hypothetical protein
VCGSKCANPSIRSRAIIGAGSHADVAVGLLDGLIGPGLKVIHRIAIARPAQEHNNQSQRFFSRLLKGQDSALRVFNLVCNIGGKICDATLGWPIINTREDRGASVLVCAHEETATIASPETIAV